MRGGSTTFALAAVVLATIAAGCDGSSATAGALASDAGSQADAAGAAVTAGDAAADVAADTAAVSACPTLDTNLCPTPAPSYANDVLPLLNARCNNCHDPNLVDGPWPLNDYGDVVAWAGAIASDLEDCSMPPADGGTPVSTAERQTIISWIVCNTPQN